MEEFVITVEFQDGNFSITINNSISIKVGVGNLHNDFSFIKSFINSNFPDMSSDEDLNPDLDCILSFLDKCTGLSGNCFASYHIDKAGNVNIETKGNISFNIFDLFK